LDLSNRSRDWKSFIARRKDATAAVTPIIVNAIIAISGQRSL